MEISFSSNIERDQKNLLINLLRVKEVHRHSKYLSLLIVIGKSIRQIFSYVKERIWKKLKWWRANFLLCASNIILVKSIAQAIPSYVMSCFKLPSYLCVDIKSFEGLWQNCSMLVIELLTYFVILILLSF